MGAIAMLVTVSAPTAQAAVCKGATLYWTSGGSQCFEKPSSDIGNKTSTKIVVSVGVKAILNFRGTRPDGKPVTPPDTYYAGEHSTPMHDNNLIEIEIKSA